MDLSSIHRNWISPARLRRGANVVPPRPAELRNLLERAALLADGDALLPEHLPFNAEPAPAHEGAPLRTELGDEVVPLAEVEVEARYLLWAAQRMPQDRTGLAQRLGMSDRTLYRKLGKSQANLA